MKKRFLMVSVIGAAVIAVGTIAIAAALSVNTTTLPAVTPQTTQGSDDASTLKVGDDKSSDDPATHDVGDDNGTDDPATHDVGDDKGGDDKGGDDDGPAHT